MTANELCERWTTREGQRLANEVLARLSSRRTLQGLGLGEIDGRLDLRGLTVPQPTRVSSTREGRLRVDTLTGLVEFDGAELRDLDLRHSQLDSIRFFRCSVVNCRFDGARCRDWRLWAVDVTDSSFVGADLRSSMLGAWHNGRGGTFRNVDFSRADFRDAVSSTATFVDCDFSYARLVKIDFDSSGFIRCRFAGELREVTFWDHGFKTGKPDPNPMEDVDFSNATLRWVEFRRLDLDRVRFPNDADHIVVRNFPCVLRSILGALHGNESPAARHLRVFCEHDLKWIGEHQQVGVFQRLDLGDDEDDRDFAVEHIRRAERECESK
jgi:uncharacterized protein YjbI with pentapeptide repeats